MTSELNEMVQYLVVAVGSDMKIDTVDSLVTHGSFNPNSLISHSFLSTKLVRRKNVFQNHTTAMIHSPYLSRQNPQILGSAKLRRDLVLHIKCDQYSDMP